MIGFRDFVQSAQAIGGRTSPAHAWPPFPACALHAWAAMDGVKDAHPDANARNTFRFLKVAQRVHRADTGLQVVTRGLVAPDAAPEQVSAACLAPLQAVDVR